MDIHDDKIQHKDKSGDFLKLNSDEWTLSFDFLSSFFKSFWVELDTWQTSRWDVWCEDCAVASIFVLVLIRCMMESGRFYNFVFNELGLLVMHGVCFESRQTYELEAQGNLFWYWNYIQNGLNCKGPKSCTFTLFFSFFPPFP